MNQDELKERFTKIYADIPLSLRNEIVLVIDDKPITWNDVWKERDNPEKLNEMLKKLEALEFI